MYSSLKCVFCIFLNNNSFTDSGGKKGNVGLNMNNGTIVNCYLKSNIAIYFDLISNCLD